MKSCLKKKRQSGWEMKKKIWKITLILRTKASDRKTCLLLKKIEKRNAHRSPSQRVWHLIIAFCAWTTGAEYTICFLAFIGIVPHSRLINTFNYALQMIRSKIHADAETTSARLPIIVAKFASLNLSFVLSCTISVSIFSKFYSLAGLSMKTLFVLLLIMILHYTFEQYCPFSKKQKRILLSNCGLTTLTSI